MDANRAFPANGPPKSTLLNPSLIGDVWAWLPRPLSGTRVPSAALLLTAFATALSLALSHRLPQQSVALVYLVAVVVGAVAFGVRTGLTVSLLAFLAYNFFFIHPVFTFSIADPQDLFALFVFLVVALVTGTLAGRMREVADEARHRATALQSLNEFAGRLSGSRTVPDVLDALVRQAAETVRGEIVVLANANDVLELRASVPPQVILASEEWQAAYRANHSGEIVYPAAPGWPGPRFEFHPIKMGAGPFGVIGIARTGNDGAIGHDDRSSIETLLKHTAIALERTALETEAARAREETEREQLRSALLSSLSHDLRTPLASILGSVTSLRELGSQMPPESQVDLLANIEEETRRLSQFVTNLLNMTRLEAGDIKLSLEWIDVGDVVRIAVSRARRLAPGFSITLTCPLTLPAIRGDSTLFEQVIFNLLDNSIKFSSKCQPIAVDVRVDDGSLLITITDQGRGIPPDALQKIFEPFYRVKEGDGEVPGTGLGLTICKRIVEGMGGMIKAESRLANGHGARMIVTMPLSPVDATTASNASESQL